jgi:leucine dehydrogenase
MVCFQAEIEPTRGVMSQQILEKMRADTRKKEPFPSLVITPLMVDGYETVVEVTDKSVGLSALIAIHDTTLGPSLGGIRMFPYAKKEDALKDVLRLSRGMTYKASVAGVGFGGGKSVIIGNPKTEKTAELLRAFGEAVTRLQGKYICAEEYSLF